MPTPSGQLPEAPIGQMGPGPCRASAQELGAPDMYSQPSDDISTLIKLTQITVPENVQLFREGMGIPTLMGENLEPVWME